MSPIVGSAARNVMKSPTRTVVARLVFASAWNALVLAPSVPSGSRYPWLVFLLPRLTNIQDNRNVTALRNRIKTHLAAQGMIKGYSSAGPRNVESQNSVLSLHSENPDTVGISSASTTPTLSITSSDDSRRPGLSISSMRDDAYYPSLPSFTSGVYSACLLCSHQFMSIPLGLMPRIEESRPSSPYGQLSTKDWD